MRLSQLSPAQRKQLVDALQDAFPTPGALERMVFFAFGKTLPQIAESGSLGEMVLALLVWADGEQKLGELIAAARDANPGNAELRAVAAVLAGGAPGGASAATPPGVFFVPYERNRFFVGREGELAKVNELLESGETVVVAGIGGQGKTQLAIEFAFRAKEQGDYPGGIFWLAMDRPEGVDAQVASFAGPLGLDLPGYDPASLEKNRDAVLAAWHVAGPPRLLVFDNLEDPALLAEWRPKVGGSRVLVTSRRLVFAPHTGATVVPLGPLDGEPARELLLASRAVALDTSVAALLAEPQEEAGQAGAAIADAICEEVGGHALALALAGHYLGAHPRVKLARYLEQLREAPLEYMARAEELDEPLPGGHEKSIVATFALSYDRLDRSKQVDALALAMLHRAAQCAPAPIPRRLLLYVAGLDPDHAAAEEQAGPALRRLHILGLFEEVAEGAQRLHRLVAAFAVQRSPDTAADRQAVELALIVESQALIEAGYPLAALPYMPHLRRAAELVAHREDIGASRLLTNLAKLLQDQRNLEGARPLFERALAIREQMLGLQHPTTANSLNNLASLLHAQGYLEGARPLFERALAVYEQVLGPQRRDTATCLNNLALLLRDQGDREGARALYERALATREQALGPQHPDTANSLNNLAGLLYAQGDVAGARALHERALAIREQVLGPQHPDTAASLNNLAVVLKDQGDLAGAWALYERALEIAEQVLGPQHPDTATGLNNLALLLREQGDLEGARALYERALAIREQVLGPQHPDTANSLNNLAYLLQAQGELAAARPLYERALGITEQVLGPQHPDNANSLNNLAGLLYAQGDVAGARALHERALEITEQVLGPQHPFTAINLSILALLLREQGDLEGARALHERALAIREQALGPQHPTIATSLNNLASLLQSQGDLQAAHSLYERALPILERVLGTDHAQTQAVRRNLASLGDARPESSGDVPLPG